MNQEPVVIQIDWLSIFSNIAWVQVFEDTARIVLPYLGSILLLELALNWGISLIVRHMELESDEGWEDIGGMDLTELWEAGVIDDDGNWDQDALDDYEW